MSRKKDPKRGTVITGWHFAEDDMRLGYNDMRKIRKGGTLSVSGKPKLCGRGLHCSERIMDALGYSRGNRICRVEVWGDLAVGDDKACGTHRKCLWHIDATNLLYEFACREAEDALALAGNPDPRSVAAIKARRDWIAGKITDKELAWAARAASATSAARAAWPASAVSVTSAAWAARAVSATRAASAASAVSATSAASAARAARAASAAQNRRLSQIILAAHRKQGGNQ